MPVSCHHCRGLLSTPKHWLVLSTTWSSVAHALISHLAWGRQLRDVTALSSEYNSELLSYASCWRPLPRLQVVPVQAAGVPISFCDAFWIIPSQRDMPGSTGGCIVPSSSRPPPSALQEHAACDRSGSCFGALSNGWDRRNRANLACRLTSWYTQQDIPEGADRQLCRGGSRWVDWAMTGAWMVGSVTAMREARRSDSTVVAMLMHVGYRGASSSSSRSQRPWRPCIYGQAMGDAPPVAEPPHSTCADGPCAGCRTVFPFARSRKINFRLSCFLPPCQSPFGHFDRAPPDPAWLLRRVNASSSARLHPWHEEKRIQEARMIIVPPQSPHHEIRKVCRRHSYLAVPLQAKLTTS